MIFEEGVYQRRASKMRGAKKASPMSIEGESVTLEQIAGRLSITVSGASLRLKKAAKLPGPITWERLGLKP